MQTKIIGLVILISLLSHSCADKYSNETKLFQKYLGEVFHEKMPENKHIYLLIAQFRCAGCVEQTLGKIAGKVTRMSKPEVTVITYDSNLIPVSLTKNVQVLLDKDSGYEAIQSIANIALIKTENGKILTVKMINLDDSDKIIEEEFNKKDSL